MKNRNFTIYYVCDEYDNVYFYSMKGILSKFLANYYCKKLSSNSSLGFYVKRTTILDLLEF